MKALLIGGTGIIGADTALFASRREDIELFLLNRGNLPQFVPPGARTIRADINDARAVLDGIAGMEFDTVADFLTYDVPALERKLEIFRGRCRQYVFVSSAAAYRYPRPFRVVTEENTPTGNPLWSYGLAKTRCEERLAEECARTGMRYTVVRPAYTYNDIRILHPYTINHWRSWTVARRLLDGRPYVLQDDGMSLCTATHAADFAKGFVGLWGNPAAMDEAFHITSDEYLTWRRIAELTADALGVAPVFCFVPTDEFVRAVDGAAAEKLAATAEHAVYDSGKLRRAVPGFSCGIRFAEGIRRTITFYRAHPEYQRVDEAWDRIFDTLAGRQPS